MRLCHWMLAAAALLHAGTARPSPAQSAAPDSASISTLAGVYTAQQASRGQNLYKAKCTACHAPTAYTGEAFTRAWATRSAYDLFALISSTMPNDDPGSLSRDQYVEIVAYLFKLNGYPAGKRPLPTDAEGLKRVRIESKEGR